MDKNISYYADLFAAMGSEPRLKIMQLLFRAYPQGMVVNEIKQELEIPNSTLSHHLEKLRVENLVTVEKNRQFLCYKADAERIEDLLSFFYVENTSNDSQTFETIENSPKEEKSMSEHLFSSIWNKLFTSLGFPLPSKFTQEAITAIKFAQCESLRLKHQYVGTEQILIGLINQKSGIAWQLLIEAELNLEKVQAEVERLVEHGSNNSIPLFIPFTARAKKMIENALQESSRLDQKYINTEHLLLGLLEDSDSLGYKILENLQANPNHLKQKLHESL